MSNMMRTRNKGSHFAKLPFSQLSVSFFFFAKLQKPMLFHTFLILVDLGFYQRISISFEGSIQTPSIKRHSKRCIFIGYKECKKHVEIKIVLLLI